MIGARQPHGSAGIKCVNKITAMSVEWMLSCIRRICVDLDLYQDGRLLDEQTLETYELQLELVYRELIALELVSALHGSSSEVIPFLHQSLRTIQEMTIACGRREGVGFGGYQAALNLDGGVGRPPFIIPRNQLAYLLMMRFTVPQISGILGVSVRTVRRRMSEYGLSVRAFYSRISDDELESVVRTIQSSYPTCGNRQMQGHLASRGIRVQQQRVRDAQRRIDPEGSALRRIRAIHRRQYSVPGPGALWHIDGNHRLIRYIGACMLMALLN